MGHIATSQYGMEGTIKSVESAIKNIKNAPSEEPVPPDARIAVFHNDIEDKEKKRMNYPLVLILFLGRPQQFSKRPSIQQYYQQAILWQPLVKRVPLFPFRELRQHYQRAMLLQP